MFITRLIMMSPKRTHVVRRDTFLRQRSLWEMFPDPKGNQRMDWWLPPNAAILASGRRSELGLCFVNAEILSSERKQSFMRDLKNEKTLGNNLTNQGCSTVSTAGLFPHISVSTLKTSLALGSHRHY